MLLTRAPLVTRGLCRSSLESGAEVWYPFTDGAPRSARVVLNPAVTRVDIVTPFRPGRAGWAVGAGRQGSERTGMCGALGLPPRAALVTPLPALVLGVYAGPPVSPRLLLRHFQS